MRAGGSGRHGRLSGRAGVAGLALIIAAGLFQPAFAQSGPQPPTDQPLGPAGARATVPVTAAPTFDSSGISASSCAFASSQLSVRLTSVMFQGATALSPDQLHKAWSDYEGRQVPLAALCKVRDRAEAMFEDAGYSYITVDIAPEQTIDPNNGAVKFVVREPSIASVIDYQFSEDIGPARERLERILAPLKGMGPIRTDAFQKAILLAREIPGVNLSINLGRSEEAGDGLKLVVRGLRDPYAAYAGIQHLNSPDFGRWAASLTGVVAGLTPYGDEIDASVYSSQSGDQAYVTLGGQIVWGEDVTFHALASYVTTSPEGAIAPLQIQGTASKLDLSVSKPLILRARYKLSASAGFEYVEQKNDLFGGSTLLFNDKLRVAKASVTGEWRTAPTRENGSALVMRANIEARHGLDILGASQKGSIDISRSDGDPEATLLRANIQALYHPIKEIGFGLELLGQWTGDALLAPEQFQIGNYTVGRGYYPGALAGDEAMGAKFELQGPDLELGNYAIASPDLRPVVAQPYAFYDMANVTSNSPGGIDRTLTSYGAGIRISMPGAFQVDLAWAKPTRPVVQGGKEPSDQFNLVFSTKLR